MEKNEFAKRVKWAKENPDALMEIIELLRPLVKSYLRKLFFIERADAEQELHLAIIEAIRGIQKCETDGQCLTYINNAVKYKYSYLCKKNSKRESLEDPYEKDVDQKPIIEDYDEVETIYDWKLKMSHLSQRKQKIFNYLAEGYSNQEIAEKMGVSRQYINRLKKEFKQLMLEPGEINHSESS